ncbi:hypothetical protein LZG74_25630 [Dyadobacter sp. CY327]|uniref:hypothetical protein n=1 Tax=Dyadobacter sp. CY327 TaxID=2907301 RepID=UPI001F41E9DE|nr:hypothetical protein [Dyadobacter sp. CY327]MCE7073715.1 hypothetical protein [Dyadobacter sp. CY327]
MTHHSDTQALQDDILKGEFEIIIRQKLFDNSQTLVALNTMNMIIDHLYSTNRLALPVTDTDRAAALELAERILKTTSNDNNDNWFFTCIRKLRSVVLSQPAVPQTWIQINSTDDLPKKPGLLNYEQIDCYVFHDGQVKELCWNCEHECWDDRDGDDHELDAMAPSHWMKRPGYPDKPYLRKSFKPDTDDLYAPKHTGE